MPPQCSRPTVMALLLQGVLLMLVLLHGHQVEAAHYKGGSISIQVLPSSVSPNPVLNITTSHAIDTGCSTIYLTHVIESIPSSFIGRTNIFTDCTGYDPVADSSFFLGSGTYSGVSESDGLITVYFASCCWASAFNSEDWKIFATLDVSSVRADTGNYNSNPVTHVPLKLTLVPGCPRYQIPITDVDGDRMKCRIATDEDDCAELCVYNEARPGNLTEDCLLDFMDGFPAGGPYLVNLIVEDFLEDSDTPLSYIFTQFIMEFSSGFPGTIEPVGFSPVSGSVVQGGRAEVVFTLYFDRVVLASAQAATFCFVDAYTREVLYTVVTNSILGRLQLDYLGMSLQLRPFIDFNKESYQGRTICILADRGYAISDSCVDQTAAIDDPTLWCFSVSRDECKFGALVNCTTHVSPDFCDHLYDPIWGPCGPNTKCEDTLDSYQCTCLHGYEHDPALTTGCKEINECTVGAYVNCVGPPSPLTCTVVFDPVWGPCGRNTSCTNLPGSYRCDCLTGYTPDPADPLGCIALCSHPTVGAHSSLTLKDNLLVQWLNEGDVAKFQCESGYHVFPGVNSWSQECLNTGSWTVAHTCVDIDECLQHPRPCGEAFCQNQPGKYVCLCLVGQVYDVRTGTCKPFSMSCEFYNVIGYCTNGGHCRLQNGRPTCSCPEGYNGPQCELHSYTLSFVLAATAFILSSILLVFLLLQCFRSRCVKSVRRAVESVPQPPQVKQLPVLRFPFLRRRNEPNYQYPLTSASSSTQELHPISDKTSFGWATK